MLEVQDFPIASPLINRLMHRAFCTSFTTATCCGVSCFKSSFNHLSGDALVTLIYHKRLDASWQEAAQALEQQLGFPVIGRSLKQKWYWA